MSKHAQQIEALLFFLNEEISKKKISDLVGLSLAEVEEALDEIRLSREDSGIVLVQTATTVSLGTHADCHALIEKIHEAETVSPLSKAALETLSIILYKAPVTRSEIDMVRGVNSLYSVRNLLVRGLVSRRTVEGKVVYEPTSETMGLLGVTESKNMVDYDTVLEKIDAIVKQEGAKEEQVAIQENNG